MKFYNITHRIRTKTPDHKSESKKRRPKKTFNLFGDQGFIRFLAGLNLFEDQGFIRFLTGLKNFNPRPDGSRVYG
jgi:hypothetical protein